MRFGLKWPWSVIISNCERCHPEDEKDIERQAVLFFMEDAEEYPRPGLFPDPVFMIPSWEEAPVVGFLVALSCSCLPTSPWFVSPSWISVFLKDSDSHKPRSIWMYEWYILWPLPGCIGCLVSLDWREGGYKAKTVKDSQNGLLPRAFCLGQSRTISKQGNGGKAS